MSNIFKTLGCSHHDYYINPELCSPSEIVSIYNPTKIHILITKTFALDITVDNDDIIEDNNDIIEDNNDDDISNDTNNDNSTEYNSDIDYDGERCNLMCTLKNTCYEMERKKDILINNLYYYEDNDDDTVIILSKNKQKIEYLLEEVEHNKTMGFNFIYLLEVVNNCNGLRFLPCITKCKNIIIDTNINIKNDIYKLLYTYILLLNKTQNNDIYNIYTKIDDYKIFNYFAAIYRIILDINDNNIYKFYICNYTNTITIFSNIHNNNYVIGLCISDEGIFYVKSSCKFDIDDGYIFDYIIINTDITNILELSFTSMLYNSSYMSYIKKYLQKNKKYCVNGIRNFVGNNIIYNIIGLCENKFVNF
jgi:hypothetical protein